LSSFSRPPHSYHFSEADARIPIKHKKAIRKPPYAASIGNKLVVSDKVKNGSSDFCRSCICESQKSKTSIMQKFREMNLHKRRKPLEQIAKEINPIIRGIINYYHHFWKDDMRIVWNQLNARLLKWVIPKAFGREKDLYKMASVKYL
jgi:hypothetical protein